MITKHILQDRAEWLEHRKHGIGGSDIACVVGANPYKSSTELYKEKIGGITPPDISDKPYVKYGTEAEEHLREIFKLDYPEMSVEYEENNSFINDRYPWARASLDGWMHDQNGRLGILEIKTSNINTAAQNDKWKDQIPQNYYCQVCMYMAVLEADFAILKAQLKHERNGEIWHVTKHYRIERADAQEDIDYIMAEGAKFWEHVESGTEPPLVLPEI